MEQPKSLPRQHGPDRKRDGITLTAQFSDNRFTHRSGKHAVRFEEEAHSGIRLRLVLARRKDSFCVTHTPVGVLLQRSTDCSQVVLIARQLILESDAGARWS